MGRSVTFQRMCVWSAGVSVDVGNFGFRKFFFFFIIIFNGETDFMNVIGRILGIEITNPW